MSASLKSYVSDLKKDPVLMAKHSNNPRQAAEAYGLESNDVQFVVNNKIEDIVINAEGVVSSVYVAK